MKRYQSRVSLAVETKRSSFHIHHILGGPFLVPSTPTASCPKSATSLLPVYVCIPLRPNHPPSVYPNLSRALGERDIFQYNEGSIHMFSSSIFSFGSISCVLRDCLAILTFWTRVASRYCLYFPHTSNPYSVPSFATLFGPRSQMLPRLLFPLGFCRLQHILVFVGSEQSL